MVLWFVIELFVTHIIIFFSIITLAPLWAIKGYLVKIPLGGAGGQRWPTDYTSSIFFTEWQISPLSEIWISVTSSESWLLKCQPWTSRSNMGWWDPPCVVDTGWSENHTTQQNANFVIGKGVFKYDITPITLGWGGGKQKRFDITFEQPVLRNVHLTTFWKILFFFFLHVMILQQLWFFPE